MPGIAINLFIEGQDDQHAFRRWTKVPRVGDLVVVRIGNERLFLPVISVLWGVTEASRDYEDADVSIVLAAPPASPAEPSTPAR